MQHGYDARREHFSTRGLREAERVEKWEEHNARALVALEARTLNGAALEATERNLRLGDLQFAHVSANPHVVRRDERQISRSTQESIAFYFTVRGESFFYDEDGVHVQRPGGLLVCDTSRPFMRGFAGGLRELVLTVPKPLFEKLSEGGAPRRPVTMDFAGPADENKHASELARVVAASIERPDAGLDGAAERVQDLIRTLFCGDARRSARGYRASALAYIERRLRDPRLSVNDVAAHVGVSERHLSRIFAEKGAGPARVILEMRLELAHRLLGSSGAPSVGEVAQNSGFSSHAHFTRVFRERFEETPTQVRARARRA